jgi:hypothetical protein
LVVNEILHIPEEGVLLDCSSDLPLLDDFEREEREFKFNGITYRLHNISK